MWGGKINEQKGALMQSPYDVTPDELFRLLTAYAAIRDPKIRAEFLSSIEAWTQDQWHGR